MDVVATEPAATMRAYVCSAMIRSVITPTVAMLALSGLLALPGIAQQSGAPDSGTPNSGTPGSGSGQSSSSSQTKQQKQQSPPAHKSAAQENPFPGDVSKQAAQQQDQPADAPAAPDAGRPDAGQPDKGQTDPGQPPAQPTQKPGSAAQENPFPEDVSKGAAAAAANSSDATGSSSSSSSNSNPAGDTDPNADLPRETGRRRLKKPSDKDIQSGSLAGEGKAQDDVRVGRYYLGTGDYQGAYGRFSEASRLDPANVDAIYGLAAAAEGLHHTDEALTNYKLYLQVAPDGKNVKSARKAVQALAK
jgi:tetratricopeptide (TPR) repeat protein